VHMEGGDVYTFGQQPTWLIADEEGGDDDDDDQLLPTAVGPLGGGGGRPAVEAFAAGPHHLLAMRTDGELIAIGSHDCGQLGVESAPPTPPAATPLVVPLPAQT